MNRELPVLDMARGSRGKRSRFLVLTKRSAASGDENVKYHKNPPHSPPWPGVGGGRDFN